MSKCIKCGRELNTGETLEIYSGMCGKCYEEQYDKFVKKIYGKYLFGVIENPLRQQIDQLKQQLAEKDKEIESLTNRTNRYENMFRSRINRTGDMQKDIELYVKQLAIQELEKLRNDIWELDIGDYYLQNGGILENIKIKRADVLKLIDQQINDLRGESK